MPRTKSPRTTTQINFRMPNDLLKEIESLADKNLRDRTSEINNACRYWIASGAGKAWAEKTDEYYAKDEVPDAADITRFARGRTASSIKREPAADTIAGLKSAVEHLTEELAAEREDAAASIAALQKDAAAAAKETARLAAAFESERNLLLKIIEGHETTINRILQFAEKNSKNSSKNSGEFQPVLEAAENRADADISE